MVDPDPAGMGLQNTFSTQTKKPSSFFHIILMLWMLTLNETTHFLLRFFLDEKKLTLNRIKTKEMKIKDLKGSG